MNVDYKEIIRPKLTPKRYFHSLCVAEEAVILAEKYGCDTKKAYVAGILHDIMKDISREEMLKMFKDFDSNTQSSMNEIPQKFYFSITKTSRKKLLALEMAH